MTRQHTGSSKASKQAFRDRFVHAYMSHGENATRAYLAVKPHVTPKTAGVEGHRLLKVPSIQGAIDKARTVLRARFNLTTERVVHETARIAYFNPRRVLDDKGKPLDLSKIDEDTAAGLHLELAPGKRGKLRVERVRMVRPSEKNAANEKLIKMLRLYDKPPPPPPDPSGERAADPRDTARRLAFMLKQEAVATAKDGQAPPPKAKKKLEIPA